MITVREVMTKKPLIAVPDTQLGDIISIMFENRIGSIFVVDDHNAPEGIVTERELIRDIAVHGKVRRGLKASDIMSKSVLRIGLDTSIVDAAEIMLSGKGRLAVVRKNNSLSGVVTSSDLLRAFSRSSRVTTFESTMSGRVKS